MVSIIILSFNTKQLLDNTLQAVINTIKSDQIEVIVFDNGSTDGSADYVKQKFPNVNVISNTENLGFGKGINKAVQSANGEYLLFLNSDAIVQNDSIADMIAYIEGSSSHIGVVGGRLVSDTNTSDSYGNFPNVRSMFRYLFLKKVDNTKFTTPTKVDWVSGGYMLLSRKVFDQVKGFDEYFFMYVEDMEFCYRLSRLGLASIYFPPAKALHVGQGSSNRSFAVINILLGLNYFFKKHYENKQYITVKIMILFKSYLLLIVGKVTGNKYLTDTYGKVAKNLR